MNATATQAKTYEHIDGGTYTVVASTGTVDGWRITITRWTTYRDNVVFEIHRESPNGVMFRLATRKSETGARTEANRWWLHETGRKSYYA